MILYFLMLAVGYYQVTLREGLKASNRYLKGRLHLFSLNRCETGAVGYCFLFSKRRLVRELEREGLTAVFSELQGFPGFCYRYRRRVGALLGVLFGIFLTYLSGEYIWQIEIVGNVTLADEEVLALLREEGVYEGAYGKGIDALAIANRMLKKSDALAFVGVNRVGNCIEVIVLEELPRGNETGGEDVPSNVVASKNGVIVSVEVESGVSSLKAGQTVSQGDLLISGVNLLRNEKYLYQAAKGHIYAETLNEISLTKPLYRYEKQYTGRILEEKTIIFFNKSKKVSKECGNLPMTCDRIEERERVMLFGTVPLPLWYVTVSYREFSLLEIPLTEEETIRLCREEILSALSEKPLISYREEIVTQEESVTLSVTYRCIEDIAEERPLFDLP
ncbi:MAG: sporulation protein YqfD [Clostridia bacterium]|nr:sporulation protein YqfD [Clostridia bacterium]